MSRNIENLRRLNNDRIDYSSASGDLPLPNFVEVQANSYDEFRESGLDEVLREAFPITGNSASDKISVDYIKCEIGEPKHTEQQCRDRSLTYSAPIHATLLLKENDIPRGQDGGESVYLGDFPLMTKSKTFIVNGAERVIVSQLIRSPGAYFKIESKSGKNIYYADLLPNRGTWLQFESDPKKDILSVRIDRQRKLNATLLIRAIGIEKDEDILALFGDYDALRKTIDKDADSVKSARGALAEIFRKMKPGEPISDDGIVNYLVQKYFDVKRYNLGRAGRFKFRKKLGIYQRLVGCTLAQNIEADGVLYFAKGHTLSQADVDELHNMELFDTNYVVNLSINTALDSHNKVNIVKVYADDTRERIINIIGCDLTDISSTVTISDIVAFFSYFLNLMDDIGTTDDIDHLGNRRVRTVGELLQNQFRLGLAKLTKHISQKISTSESGNMKLKQFVNSSALNSAIKEFLGSSQLSAFMDQVNPLSELTNKRRLSALGPGGLTRDRASIEVRDVHASHYGRICPVETPEGQNVGLISNLACYAKIDKHGFIQTPYRKVEKDTYRVLNGAEDSVYLTADEEYYHVIAEANIRLGANNEILDERVVARFHGEDVLARREDVEFVDVSPKQIVSIAAGSIPFLENDDTKRALMGANMQRQALPLLNPHTPIVGTGLEHQIAHDSGLAVVCQEEGVVTYVDSKKILVKEKGVKEPHEYKLKNFERSNQGTCISQHATVKVGDKVHKDQIIGDGPSMDHGDIALGQNVTIAFMTWNGYNYEDAVIMSERLVKDDVYTSIHIEKYDIECRSIAKLGDEKFTTDIPNVSEAAKAHLDEDGIIIVGSEVRDGDILVGKVTPKGASEPTPDERLLQAIFKEKVDQGKDASLRVPHGGGGTVIDVKRIKRERGDEFGPDVNEIVSVYVAQKRKISEGDKMSGRHGNKGVISRILPENDMPYLPDGTPIDIMLSPLGVPSRMNIGQLLEVHLGMALKALGYKVASPVFDGIKIDEIQEMMQKAGMDPDGKTILYDGRTGERFDQRVTVGVMYMIKLDHMVDDKLHARATGPYSLVTQQPLGGKAQNGGQRFGEMEVWALEAYGAAHVLQELLTIKSDDRVGRRKTYEAIVRGKELPKPGIPEAFKVLIKELQALSLDITLFDDRNNELDMDKLAREADKEERRINQNIRNLVGESEVETVVVLDESLGANED